MFGPIVGDVIDIGIVGILPGKLNAGLVGGVTTHFTEPVEAEKAYNCFKAVHTYKVPRAPIVK